MKLKKCLNGLNELHLNGRLFKFGYGPNEINTELIFKGIRCSPLNEYTSPRKHDFVWLYSVDGRLIRVFNNSVETAMYFGVEDRYIVSLIKHSIIINNNILIGEPSRQWIKDYL